MAYKFVFQIFSLIFFLSYAPWANAQKFHIRTIVIDAGHGGVKAGAVGNISKEKNVALQVAMALGSRIKSELAGVKVIYTRTSDKDVDLFQRAEKANHLKADLFISIHLNSLPKIKKFVGYTKLKNGKKQKKYESSSDASGMGTETFVAGTGRLHEQDVAIRENADIFLEKDYKKNYQNYNPKSPTSNIIFSLMKNGSRQKSIQLAKLIQQNYVATGRKSRGVKEQNILILQRCAMPAVLTEIGFISNPKEEQYLNSKTGQRNIANSIFKAVEKYKKLNDIN